VLLLLPARLQHPQLLLLPLAQVQQLAAAAAVRLL
jgi:hypothetical protein